MQTIAVAEDVIDGSIFPQGVEIIVSALIRNAKGEILLIRQPKWGDVWTLPGGHLEPGETLEAGARREGEEETGLRLSMGELVDWGEMIDTDNLTHPVHFIYFDYAFSAKNSSLQPDSSEVSETKWVQPKAALSLKVSSGYRRTIVKYLERS